MAQGGILYATDSDGNPNIFDFEHDDNGRWLNDNYGDPTISGKATTGSCSSAANRFISPPASRGSFALELPVPTAEHPADLIHSKRQRDVLLVIDRFRFPEAHKEDFELSVFRMQSLT